MSALLTITMTEKYFKSLLCTHNYKIAILANKYVNKTIGVYEVRNCFLSGGIATEDSSDMFTLTVILLCCKVIFCMYVDITLLLNDAV